MQSLWSHPIEPCSLALLTAAALHAANGGMALRVRDTTPNVLATVGSAMQFEGQVWLFILTRRHPVRETS